MRIAKIVMAALVIASVMSVSALAYTDVYPENAPLMGGVYLHCMTSDVGEAIIYVPIDYKNGYITTRLNNDSLVNISGETITCYMYSGDGFGNYYDCRMESGGGFEYYTFTTELEYDVVSEQFVEVPVWNWFPVGVYQILNTNIQLANNFGNNAIRQIPRPDVISIIIFAFLAIIVVLMITRKR